MFGNRKTNKVNNNKKRLADNLRKLGEFHRTYTGGDREGEFDELADKVEKGSLGHGDKRKIQGLGGRHYDDVYRSQVPDAKRQEHDKIVSDIGKDALGLWAVLCARR